MKLNAQLSFGDEAGVQELRTNFYAALAEEGYIDDPTDVVGRILAMAPTLGDIRLPGDLYDWDDGALMLKNVDRGLYQLKVSANAATTRRQHPMFFAAPGWYYVRDRALFHSIYDPIQIPLLVKRTASRTEFGVGVDTPGWMQYFVTTALRHDLLRLMMYGDAAMLRARLGYYADMMGNHNRSIALRFVIEHVLPPSPLRQELLDWVQAL